MPEYKFSPNGADSFQSRMAGFARKLFGGEQKTIETPGDASRKNILAKLADLLAEEGNATAEKMAQYIALSHHEVRDKYIDSKFYDILDELKRMEQFRNICRNNSTNTFFDVSSALRAETPMMEYSLRPLGIVLTEFVNIVEGNINTTDFTIPAHRETFLAQMESFKVKIISLIQRKIAVARELKGEDAVSSLSLVQIAEAYTVIEQNFLAGYEKLYTAIRIWLAEFN